MNSVKIRKYKSGDANKIFSLFNQYTEYDRDAKFWVWSNRLLSEEKSIIVVGEYGNNIIGHYALLPKLINIDGKRHKAAFAFHAFIHPEYRKGFLIMQITKTMYKIAKEYGIEFIYGFPNENFREIQIKADKWKEVSLFNALIKKRLALSDTKLNLTSISYKYDDIYALSEIIDSSINIQNIYIEKSLNYYINRYIRHPQELYENFFIVQDNIKVGFICLKIYGDRNTQTGHLIDYVISSAINFQEVLNIVENYFYNKVSQLSVWKFNEKDKECLKKNHFEEKGFQTFLGIKMIDENRELEEKLTNFKNWNLCMGDSDAF